jgi:putative ABC transport system permease protein
MNNKLLSGVSLLNLIGGFTAFVLLSLYLQFHFDYDKHNQFFDRIYRLQVFMDVPHSPNPHTSSITAALGRHELMNLPEIEQVAVIHNAGNGNIDGYYFSVNKDTPILLKWGFYSDPEIFQIFDFEFIEGSVAQALTEPNTIVLSESDARIFFPEGEVVGKSLLLENKIPLTVSAVYRDLPKNSDWRPEYLLPMLSYSDYTGEKDFEDNYWMYSFGIYVLLAENADYEQVNAKIYDAFKNYREYHHPYLRPLAKIHLYSNYQPDYYIALGLLGFMAVLILVLAAINYINLQTADANSRAREIGIKKSVGYTYRELWRQYVLEGVFETMGCALVALLAAYYIRPLYYRILGQELDAQVFSNLGLVLLVIGAAALTGFISSLYPASIISRFNPVKALKQRFIQVEQNGFSLKKVLVALQFAISLFIVINSFIIYNQASYMVNKNMGFERDNLLVASLKTYRFGSFEPVRQRLLEHPEIVDACFSDYVPFILPGGDEMTWEGAAPGDQSFVRVYNVSYDFFDTYGMKIVGGREFSRDYPADAGKCLVNEEAVKIFGWKDPLGMNVMWRNHDREVVGVVRNFVAQSVHNPIEPHTYRLMGDSVLLTGMYSVRYAPGAKGKAEEIIRSTFEEFYPMDAFQFEPFGNLILSENATRIWGFLRNIFFMFAVFSILISSVGLFGLVLYYCRKKMKEIGIRKVMGFSVGRLYLNLAGEFVGLIFIGIIFSWLGSWYVYRVLPGADKYGLGMSEFLVGTAIVFLVAILTISYNIWIAARTNAAEILKYE